MKVLGIDPGIELTGFGVVDIASGQRDLVAYGVVRTNRADSHAHRLVVLQHDVAQLLVQYPDIGLVGIEELFFSKNTKTALLVAEARGVILYTVAAAGLPLQPVKPVQVKSAIIGSGQASKRDMQRTIQLLFALPEPPQPDDAADAIAIAVTAAAFYQQAQSH